MVVVLVTNMSPPTAGKTCRWTRVPRLETVRHICETRCHDELLVLYQRNDKSIEEGTRDTKNGFVLKMKSVDFDIAGSMEYYSEHKRTIAVHLVYRAVFSCPC